MINPGDLDQEITIQVGAEVRAPNGELSYDFDHPTSVIVTWAQWHPEKPTELFKDAHRLASYVAGIFRTWDNIPHPTPYNTRILWNGFVFDVAPGRIVGDRGDGLEIPVTARGE